MKILDSLEKRFGHLAIPNVVLFLVIAQLVMLAAILTGLVHFISLLLFPNAVIAGEWWRLISFVLAPPHIPSGPGEAMFLAFYWYIFWMISGSLEEAWGVFRFNLFLLCGFVFSIFGAFLGMIISPEAMVLVLPKFLYLSVFFAYATLNPNVQFLVMFVLPVKVKWLAWLMAAYIFSILLKVGSLGGWIIILAPMLNYFLFFRDAMTQSVKSRQRRAKFDKERRATAEEALHTCATCGASDRSNPEREFRYKMVDGDAVCVCSACRS